MLSIVCCASFARCLPPRALPSSASPRLFSRAPSQSASHRATRSRGGARPRNPKGPHTQQTTPLRPAPRRIHACMRGSRRRSRPAARHGAEAHATESAAIDRLMRDRAALGRGRVALGRGRVALDHLMRDRAAWSSRPEPMRTDANSEACAAGDRRDSAGRVRRTVVTERTNPLARAKFRRRRSSAKFRAGEGQHSLGRRALT